MTGMMGMGMITEMATMHTVAQSMERTAQLAA